jgi:hypothetical protein
MCPLPFRLHFTAPNYAGLQPSFPPFTPAFHSATLHSSIRGSSPITSPPFTLALHSRPSLPPSTLTLHSPSLHPSLPPFIPPPFTPAHHSRPSLRRPSPFAPSPFTAAIQLRRPSPFISPLFTLQSHPSLLLFTAPPFSVHPVALHCRHLTHTLSRLHSPTLLELEYHRRTDRVQREGRFVCEKTVKVDCCNN